MASLHGLANKTNHVLGAIGQKIKTGAEIAGAIKTIWEVGKMVAPAVGMLL